MSLRVVIDGLPISGMSLGIVVEHLLEGWHQLETDDELHLVVGPTADLVIPESVTVHRVPFGRRDMVSRLQAQSVTVPRLCRQVKADVMLGVLPTTTFTPLPCPRALIAYDLRHEQRPEQFPAASRWMRRISYDVGFAQADAVACISERTRRDLLASHRRLRSRVVRVTHLGADHVASWPVGGRADPAYALAFGQYGNKNVDLVLDGWARLVAAGAAVPLVLVGLPEADRTAVQARVAGLGLGELVTVLPWLPIESFRETFASASMVVFPSDFEGFGLPAVEAMWLGIPVVITPEPALLEVAGGHAIVMDDHSAEALARAVPLAGQVSSVDLASAQARAHEFTWRRTAQAMRDMLGEAVARRA
ncbi:MAG TPA: glycosyltransferase family 1 protein [Acidimicrobiales bacterium]|jgi:glycosyltransferase involved in cell wall biosynthesis|nr:glycosyltransferase family 1 protein [Acidimicrobiales bacterium]